MDINFLIRKQREYGLLNFFYRALVRIIPNNLRYPYYLFRKHIFGHATIDINGIKMFLDLKNDDGLCKEVLINGKREPYTIDYLLQSNILKEGGVTLDVGGNIGYYALPEAKLVGKSGKVFAVEPVRSNYELLKKNVELNQFRNVKVYQMAMGDKEGEASIYIRAKKNLSSLTEIPEDAKGGILGKESVPMTTVDTFAEKEIGMMPEFVRMDVEGYEISILEGMHKTLASGATLLIEFHPMFLNVEQKERIIELFTMYGYNKIVLTVNPKSKPNAVHRFLNKKIGLSGKPAGLIKEGDLSDFRALLFTSPRVFNAFIFRQ